MDYCSVHYSYLRGEHFCCVEQMLKQSVLRTSTPLFVMPYLLLLDPERNKLHVRTVGEKRFKYVVNRIGW